MNQRPLGYEPNELPDCSTPRVDTMKLRASCQGKSQPSAEIRRGAEEHECRGETGNRGRAGRAEGLRGNAIYRCLASSPRSIPHAAEMSQPRLSRMVAVRPAS